MTTATITHPVPGTVTAVTVKSGSIVCTVTASMTNKTPVAVSSNPGVCIYPWLGANLSAGQTAVVGVTSGQSLYCHSPGGPASLSLSY
jgi:hypothetical protein